MTDEQSRRDAPRERTGPGQDELARRLEAAEQELALNVRELADTYEKLSAVYRFSETLGAEMRIETLCEKTAEEVRNTLEVECASVMLIDRETDELVTVASTGGREDASRQYRLRRGEGVPWYVLDTRKPLNVCDVSRHPVHVPSPHTRTSLIAAPLIAKGKTLGVICASDKPDGAEFFSNELKLLASIANQAAIALENAALYHNLENLFVSIVRSFAAALDAKSAWTAGHSERVTRYSVSIAESLGSDAAFVEEIRTCGLLHDIGKIGIPEQILDKPGSITPDEHFTIAQHTLKGAKILEHIHTFENIIPGIKHHHERWDGGGFPEGLRGGDIPLIARILAVADAYDAITSNRPYRSRRGKTAAVEEIRRCSGSQFDPAVVNAFLAAAERNVI